MCIYGTVKINSHSTSYANSTNLLVYISMQNSQDTLLTHNLIHFPYRVLLFAYIRKPMSLNNLLCEIRIHFSLTVCLPLSFPQNNIQHLLYPLGKSTGKLTKQDKS